MRKKFVFIQKTIKISEIQQKKLDDIMATGSFAVEADIFRQGLDAIHRKIMPPYLQPTAAGEMKREKIDKEKAFAAIPDEEFVANNLEDVYIYTDEDNVKWVLFRTMGNDIGAVMLSNVKEWVRSKDPEYVYHKQVANDGHKPYEEVLNDRETYVGPSTRKRLAEHYGVAITL